MPRARPTIRQWMNEYNRLVAIANSRGVRDMTSGRPRHFRPYANMRCSNEVAERRVAHLARLLNESLRLGNFDVQDQNNPNAEWIRRSHERDLERGTRQVPVPPPQNPDALINDELRTGRPISAGGGAGYGG